MGESYTGKSFSRTTHAAVIVHTTVGRKKRERLKRDEKEKGGRRREDHGIPINQTLWGKERNKETVRYRIKLKSIPLDTDYPLSVFFFFYEKTIVNHRGKREIKERSRFRERRGKNLTKISVVLGVQIFIQSGDFVRTYVVCTFSLRANESVGARTSRRECREWRQDANTLCIRGKATPSPFSFENRYASWTLATITNSKPAERWTSTPRLRSKWHTFVCADVQIEFSLTI